MGFTPDFEVFGQNNAAPFSLKIFRGESMALLGMNWLNGPPPDNFAGFTIEYMEPGGTQFYAVNNRLSFLDNNGNVNPNILSSRLSPIQKFRWIHFPYHANLSGDYTYRVTPVFMDNKHVLSYGEFQQASINLQGETYPGELNVAFTRGFIASQAFLDRFAKDGDVSTLLPNNAKQGLTFTPTNPKAADALDWMGFEARAAILKLLDQAVNDTNAQVRVTAYDLNEPEIVKRLVKLKNRLKIIIDDSGSHGDPDSAETQAADQLKASAGEAHVQRQKVGGLQHNKTIAVNGSVKSAVCGSTNFSWRGFFVQNNNAIIVYGEAPVQLFFEAFDNLWDHPDNASGFAATGSANWNDLQLPNVKAKIGFSPHNADNALLQDIAKDIAQTTSTLLYSLAFLYQTPGVILNSIKKETEDHNIFVYGISDKSVGGLDLQKPDGNPPVVFPARLLTNLPEPFKTEASDGGGIRMHHKFVVIDFDKPTARVYMGSYNFSSAADLHNGENLLLIQDRRVAVSYMIEALAMFDHYEFRDVQQKSAAADHKLYLQLPPAKPGELPWWSGSYTNPQKIRDRELFSKK
ncbi:phosphatidylserine/phosphatidylglycerophosphate/cardiolipin synthase-like enzyme [Pedobacter cryoconitis]|uniref:phospholipase D-like domain-containing protein n=1 Tax=Pedobacter cryoconitis TaxID=188932 RepID=UPI00161570DE|nr:phospholipase D-like domain-containing protein [Pedobacter cryoconitis]MBB6270694.1 phosphatidylserine/phosphatidylglycerophosphate/cardiolipin synthase-like enzyme [Pedobacter cryoconitis]